MQFLAAMVLPTLACLAMVLITSLMWWHTLASPWQFVVFGLFLCLGLHRVLQVVAELIKKSATFEGFIVARRNRPDFFKLTLEALTVEALIVTALLVALGIPLLQWLRNALPRA